MAIAYFFIIGDMDFRVFLKIVFKEKKKIYDFYIIMLNDSVVYPSCIYLLVGNLFN